MFFTSTSNVSTSAAATRPSFGATTTLHGMRGGGTSGFGFIFSGVNGAASTVPTKILELLGCVWVLIGYVLHSKQHYTVYFPAPTSMITTVTVTSTIASTTTTNSGFNFGLQSLTSTGINKTVPVRYASTSSATNVNAIKTPVMTYGELDGLVNKWSLELQNEEKHFLQQASQITILHRKLEKVKLHPKRKNLRCPRLEQELDFVLSQQWELEDLLTPLEVAVNCHSRSVYTQYGDEDFERTYKLAENIDAQMKGMVQDLKDVTEQVKLFGRPADTTETIYRILNAHLDSLQWIKKNSGMLQMKLHELTRVFKELSSPGAGIQHQDFF